MWFENSVCMLKFLNNFLKVSKIWNIYNLKLRFEVIILVDIFVKYKVILMYWIDVVCVFCFVIIFLRMGWIKV